MAEGNSCSNDYETLYHAIHYMANEAGYTWSSYREYLRQLKELNNTLKTYKGEDSVIAPDYEPFMKETVAAVNRFISEYQELKIS